MYKIIRFTAFQFNKLNDKEKISDKEYKKIEEVLELVMSNNTQSDKS